MLGQKKYFIVSVIIILPFLPVVGAIFKNNTYEIQEEFSLE